MTMMNLFAETRVLKVSWISGTITYTAFTTITHAENYIAITM
jgi:hypothetical protein